jgi:hypothetical protein
MEAPTPNIATLDTKVLDAIGRALTVHYDDLVKAPLPEEFLDLLARLEKQEQRRGENRRKSRMPPASHA